MRSRMAFRALGTLAVVVVTDPEALPTAMAMVAAEISACDRACSRFRDDSDLSRLNAAGGRLVDVSSRLLDELAAAMRAAHLTDGVVDPTVGRALVSLGYDRDFPLVASTDRPGTIRLIPVPGWQCLHIDLARGRAQVRQHPRRLRGLHRQPDPLRGRHRHHRGGHRFAARAPRLPGGPRRRL